MTAKELMNPRYEVIADYPSSFYELNQILYCNENLNMPVFFDKYPHIFKKLNWWEHRRVEDMPKKLICKAIPNDTETIEIEEWDMNILVGWRNKAKRECASLRSFNPEYGYFPVD